MTDKFKFRIPDISSAGLHILAMGLMLLDHMWATVTPGHGWMTALGRIAFPLFAFMAAEGYHRTHDFRKYMLRLLAFALISEIPFDLMYGAMPFYPFHQNVIWTFLIALLLVKAMERIRLHLGEKYPERPAARIALTVLTHGLLILTGFLLGFGLFVDYYGIGVATVFVFCFFRGRKWYHLLGQLVCLWWLNVELLGGRTYLFDFMGHRFEIVQQGLALLALIPIWLYRGRKGHHSKAFQYFCYAFYPAHILILWLIA